MAAISVLGGEVPEVPSAVRVHGRPLRLVFTLQTEAQDCMCW